MLSQERGTCSNFKGGESGRPYKGDVSHFCRLSDSRGILGFKFHVH